MQLSQKQTVSLLIIIALSLGAGLVAGMKSEKVNVSWLGELNDGAGAMNAWPVADSVPAGSNEVARLPQDFCSPEPDGICGWDFIIFEFQKKIFIEQQVGSGNLFYGPLDGGSSESLRIIQDVARYVKTLKN